MPIGRVVSATLDKLDCKNIDGDVLYFHHETLEVSYKNRTVQLTRKEFLILIELHSSLGCVCSRQELLAKVWGEGVFVDARTIDRHVVRLRRKLKTIKHPTLCVDTVWGIGYRLRAVGSD